MYSSTQITVLILLIFGCIIGLSFVFFTRQTKNFFIALLPKYKKRYVVCHMVYQNGMEDVYNVVPNPDGLTKVGDFSYQLIDKYITLHHKKMAHFVLNENNAIPRHFERQTNESIIFQYMVMNNDKNIMAICGMILFSKNHARISKIITSIKGSGIISFTPQEYLDYRYDCAHTHENEQYVEF